MMTRNPVNAKVTSTPYFDLGVLSAAFGSLDFGIVLDVILVRLESFGCCVYKVQKVMCRLVFLIVEGTDCGLIIKPYYNRAKDLKS